MEPNGPHLKPSLPVLLWAKGALSPGRVSAIIKAAPDCSDKARAKPPEATGPCGDLELERRPGKPSLHLSQNTRLTIFGRSL